MTPRPPRVAAAPADDSMVGALVGNAAAAAAGSGAAVLADAERAHRVTTVRRGHPVLRGRLHEARP